MKKESNSSMQLLVELPLTLSHIVSKRGRMLRNGGTNGVTTLLKSNEKSWHATSIRNKTSPWDGAHELAGRLKQEFNTAVYVEPDAGGRFQELTSPGADPFNADETANQSGLGWPQSHTQNMSGFAGLGNFGPGFGSTSGFDLMAGHMPGIPNPMDFLPKQAADMMGLGSNEKPNSRHKSLVFPALQAAIGWSELAQATQKMFEVEAAQLMNNGFQSHSGLDVVDEYSALVVLAMQSSISKALKRFLERTTAGVNSGQPIAEPEAAA